MFWSGDLRARAAQLQWIHTTQSTRRLYRLVETGRASVQKVTISQQGGRWWVSFSCRISQPVAVTPRRVEGDVVGVDVGLRYLATLSRPVEGLVDEHGHVPNPRVLASRLRELRRVNRSVSRSVKGSKNHRRWKRRLARLHGEIARTRALHLHRLSKQLASRFEVVVVEDLNVAGMSRRRKGQGRGLGRAVADASWGELTHQLSYKTHDHGHLLVKVDRFFASSKTCAECGTVKAKLDRHIRVYECDACGHVTDRDVNAAVNLATEGRRLLEAEEDSFLAGLRPERLSGDPRPGKTTPSGVALVA